VAEMLLNAQSKLLVASPLHPPSKAEGKEVAAPLYSP